MLEIDHIVLGVTDLDAAAEHLLRRHGLASLAGGRHPAWGTANRIVPLGSTYLELVTVADRAVAAVSGFGRWVTAMTEGGPTLGWAARTDDLDAVAARLGLVMVDGSRVDGDGRVLQWRLAGVEAAAAEPALPFFIQWGTGTAHPGQAAVRHPRPTSLATLEIGHGGSPERLVSWLGVTVARLDVREGPMVVQRLLLATATGEEALDFAALRRQGRDPAC